MSRFSFNASPRFSGMLIYDYKEFAAEASENTKRMALRTKLYTDTATKMTHLDPQVFGITIGYNSEKALEDELARGLTKDGVDFKRLDSWFPMPLAKMLVETMDGMTAKKDFIVQFMNTMLALDANRDRDLYAEADEARKANQPPQS